MTKAETWGVTEGAASGEEAERRLGNVEHGYGCTDMVFVHIWTAVRILVSVWIQTSVQIWTSVWIHMSVWIWCLRG